MGAPRDLALCSCGHSARKHWLAGGDLERQGHLPYLTRNPSGLQAVRDFDDWPPYYRAACIKCDCKHFELDGGR